jgi:ABC-2 type transport system permease protein
MKSDDVIGIIVAIALVVRVFIGISRKRSKGFTGSTKKVYRQRQTLSPWQRQLWTVLVFTKLSTLRFFRDKLAIFFGILFPLIFLFVFGFLNSGSGNVSFKLAVINESRDPFAYKFEHQIESSKVFKVDTTLTSLSTAKNKMSNNQIDGIIVLPKDFGTLKSGEKYPSGQVQILYDEAEATTGQTLTSVIQNILGKVNDKLVSTRAPLSAVGVQQNVKTLSTFDYTFSGLLGFSIIGLGIFGPVNVFPELKKQGILRRLHTTPIRVWQYFLATMFSQATTGLVSIAVQFVVAISVFHLKVDGNYLEIILFTILSIFMILGIGLAIGGWAKNERQAAPLSNIIVFPMLFLSGTFFPRFDMPAWLQTVTTYLPLTPVIDGLRQLTTEGKNFTDIGPQIGLVLVWMVIVYAVAFRVFKWE